MEYKVEYKKQLQSRSERVKCVDLHSELPWVVSGLYNGQVSIHDHSSQQLLKSMEVCGLPVRAVRFLECHQWVVVGSDDFMLRLLNQNTFEKVAQIKAHDDYIRDIRIAERQVITSSDDTTIKVWAAKEEGLDLVKTLKEHTHFVMQICVSPKDPQMLASCSLDTTVKVWNVNFPKSQITLTGHEQGVNCVEYFRGDKPYILSGGDDRLIKIWDYQTKQNIQTLQGHADNVVFLLVHPQLPLIISGSEDNAVRLWGKHQFNSLSDLHFNMERPWGVAAQQNLLAVGFDMGTLVVKLGSDKVVADHCQGRLIYAKNQDIHFANLKALNANTIQEQEVLSNMNHKHLGSVDIYPRQLIFSANGHVFCVLSEEEYVIYRTQTFKSQHFGKARHFAFNDSLHDQSYATLHEGSLKVFKLHQNQQQDSLDIDFQVDAIYGGKFLVLQNTDFLMFYHWSSLEVLQKIDITATQCFWSQDYQQLALTNSSQELFVLQYSSEQDSFELTQELQDTVQSGLFVDNIFFFVSSTNKLHYVMENTSFFVCAVKKGYQLLCYQQQLGKLLLTGQDNSLITVSYPFDIVRFQNLISQDQEEAALEVLPRIDSQYIDKISEFLQKVGHNQLAYRIVVDQNVKFDLALQLHKVEEAAQIAVQLDNQYKYQELGDLALELGFIEIAVQSYKSSQDLNSLLLIFSSLGLKDDLLALAESAQQQNKFNVAFMGYHLCGETQKCLDLLVASKRLPEAAVMARAYQPSSLSALMQQWKDSLKETHPISSQILDPEYPQEELEQLLSLEEQSKQLVPKEKVPAHQHSAFLAALMEHQEVRRVVQARKSALEWTGPTLLWKECTWPKSNSTMPRSDLWYSPIVLRPEYIS